MIDYEKDAAYVKCKCQIQELESQVVILREEVTKLHKVIEKGDSAVLNMKECPNCAKMQESQKKLGILIDTQRISKGKAGLGYDTYLDRSEDKGKGKEVEEKKKKKNHPSWFQHNTKVQNFNGYCFKCNNYGHKAAHCRMIETLKEIFTNNRFACLKLNKIECFRCGKVEHIARHCIANFSIECFKYKKLGHIARECRFSSQKF